MNIYLAYGKRILNGSFGLVLCAIGLYLCIQANVGLAPWDALTIGISMKTGILYGDVSVLIGLVILVLDVILKEKIGVLTIMNTILIGKFVDVLNIVNILPKIDNFIVGLIVLFIGQVILCFGCYFYIKPGLGCGPRDSLMVAFGKRLNRVPIGFVRGVIECTVMIMGWLLGAKVGIGTVIVMFSISAITQWVFDLMKFDVKALKHEDVLDTVKIICKK